MSSLDDPFKMVNQDLEKTKQFAINKILSTNYKEIEEAAHYNLLLKGKNFRSAILFTLARAIHANN
jgi:geranylgeranyl pyrophosphate synthase